jgi:hypothetical protein
MLTIKQDKTNKLKLAISGKMQSSDIDQLAKIADDLIKKHGKVKLFINGAKFDGWEDFSTMQKHFRFVQEHHNYVEKLAIITGPWWQNFMLSFAKIFIHPKVKTFQAGEDSAVEKWLES